MQTPLEGSIRMGVLPQFNAGSALQSKLGSIPQMIRIQLESTSLLLTKWNKFHCERFFALHLRDNDCT